MKLNDLVGEVKGNSDKFPDRREFHKQSQSALERLAAPDVIHEVFEKNLSDPIFLKKEWSTYEIPCLYIFENNHYYLKYHVFLPIKSRDTAKAANIIHHHNNYLLTSYTVQGSGYNTMHFGKEITPNADGSVKISLEKEFLHGNKEFSFVDSYEPHIVFNMKDLTTTLVLWSPDKLHTTDGLRTHPLIKPFKKVLLAGIHALGLSRNFGVADKDVVQWYAKDGKCWPIGEEQYFEPYKNEKGAEINQLYSNAIGLFVQQSGYNNKAFLQEKLEDESLPQHWKNTLEIMLNGQEIPEMFGREEINIPQKTLTQTEIKEACK